MKNVRKRGRPRKNEVSLKEKTSGRRGRPRKNEVPLIKKTTGRRGRPRKIVRFLYKNELNKY